MLILPSSIAPGIYKVTVTAFELSGASTSQVIQLSVVMNTDGNSSNGGSFGTSGNSGTQTGSISSNDQRLSEILNTYSTVS